MLLILLLGMSVGCHPENEISRDTQHQLSLNQLSLNQLSLNQLSLNQLSLNQLSADALAQDAGQMISTHHGRRALQYVVQCALSDDQQVSFSHAGSQYSFSGRFGLTPHWTTGALSASDRRWISACLLAHVNAYGARIHISARTSSGIVMASSAEQTEYPVYEASFFGDVFSGPSNIYACQGSPRAIAQAHSSDRSMRVCSDDTEDCMINALGPCHGICDSYLSHIGSIGCQADGEYYTEIFSVWLRDEDTDGDNDQCTPGESCWFECEENCDHSVFDCVETGSCETSCGAGNVCTTHCGASADCEIDCTGGVCNADCVDTAECDAECEQGSECEIDCRGSAECDEIACTGDSECLLICDDGDPVCKFSACDGVITECGGGVRACNRACP